MTSGERWVEAAVTELFPAVFESLPGPPQARLRQAIREVCDRAQGRLADGGLDPRDLGVLYERLLRYEVSEGELVLSRRGRKASGTFYTPPAVVAEIVERTLTPLLDGREPRILDPAMGCGQFLLIAFDHLVAHGVRPAAALRSLHGIDLDPVAVTLARRSLRAHSGLAAPELDDHLVLGDGLADRRDLPRFDAVIGNPPWVSYVGRAAQPLPEEVRARYAARFRAFAGYRNLQGLFIERAAELLRPGGRLGLLIPSSMSELAGYGATRRAHDRWCEPLDELPDFGQGAFEGVFQPCMALLSVRRAEPVEVADRPWPIRRDDLSRADRELIDRLSAGPRLPRHLFGERGVQTSGQDLEHLAPAPGPGLVPLRTGADIRAFERRAPSHQAEVDWFGPRLRTVEAWREVRLLIRQTAPWPIAAPSDGGAFRNSILAGFADDDWPAEFLLAWLNSTPVRWLHLVRHRDARQGMPQVKIAHLRTTPAPVVADPVGELTRFGARLAARNTGITAAEQARLDALAAAALGVNEDELARMAARLRSR